MKRFFSLTCALALTATLLTGCGNSASQPAPSASQPEETDYTLVTLTNYGREITVSKLPEKVLTLGPNCTELFVALGPVSYTHLFHLVGEHIRFLLSVEKP